MACTAVSRSGGGSTTASGGVSMTNDTTDSSITVEHETATVVVRLRGEIDVNLRDQASAALAQVVLGELPAVIDLADARLIGATGVAFLLQCRRACDQVGLSCTLRAVPPRIARVLASLDLDALPLAEATPRTEQPV